MEREFFLSHISEGKRNFLRYPLIIIIAAILGTASLFGHISPFAAAFVGSLYGSSCGAAFLGSIIGLAFTGDLGAIIPPAVAIASVTIVRIFFGKSETLPVRISSAVLVSIAVTLTNIVTAQQPTDLIYSVVFGIIAGGACFALSQIYRLMKEENLVALMKPANTAAVGIVTSLAVAALSSIEINIFNWGIVLSGIIIALCAYKFRFAGGAVAGIVCTFGMALADTELITAGLILCVGGVIAGIFAHFGKIPQAASFVLASAITAVTLGLSGNTLMYIADALVSSVAFMAMPVNDITKKFRAQKTKITGSDPQEVFANRLLFVGNTMAELKFAVEKTAETLDRSINRDISWVYNSACDKICCNCRYNIQCWGDEYSDSVRQMNSLISLLKDGKRIGEDNLHGIIATRCGRKGQLINEINTKYIEYVNSVQTIRKISEMRALLTNQLQSTEKMFIQMSEEFENPQSYNLSYAAKVEKILERCGLVNTKAAVVTAGGNLSIEAYGEGQLGVTAEELGDRLSEILQREFDLPDVAVFRKKVRITAFERAQYMIKTARCQFSRTKEQASGDFVDTFVDGKGCAYTVLSDGMGSGGRARIDSAFACGMLLKMLEAGIGIEVAVEILNSSLLVKSADESFATLDVLKIDLYTGKTMIYKAGGSDTFIKTGKHVVKLEGKGFPVGISFKVALENKSFTISEDDIIILTSDGAEIPEKWLEQALEKESGQNLDTLVKTIASTAKFNCEKGREDDISIVAVKLVR